MNASVTPLRRTTQPVTLIRYLDHTGAEHVVNLDEAKEVDFEHTRPVRGFTYSSSQWHTPGWYWCATTESMLAYESWLERNWLVICDRDPDIVAISTQPMEVDAHTDGHWQHYPDFFTRHADGHGELVDVKHPSKLDEPDVITQARRTGALCRKLGWGYRLVGHIDTQLARNLNWLAGYRRPLSDQDDLAARLAHVAVHGATIDALAAHVGDDPAFTRAVTYHLLWTGDLTADLTRPLNGWTTVHIRRTP